MLVDEYKYNTQREVLKMPEYGRNLQMLTNSMLEIEDRKERTKFAKGIISTMANLRSINKNLDENKVKLWDHLTIISDFKLDVDSPFPLPKKEDLKKAPNIVPYCKNRISYKHYGKTVELMIKEAIEMEDPEKKKILIFQIANHMKRLYITWNKDRSVGDDIIKKDLLELSNGQLAFNEDLKLADSKKILKPSARSVNGNNSNNWKNNRSNNNNNINKQRNKRKRK